MDVDTAIRIWREMRSAGDRVPGVALRKLRSSFVPFLDAVQTEIEAAIQIPVTEDPTAVRADAETELAQEEAALDRGVLAELEAATEEANASGETRRLERALEAARSRRSQILERNQRLDSAMQSNDAAIESLRTKKRALQRLGRAHRRLIWRGLISGWGASSLAWMLDKGLLVAELCLAIWVSIQLQPYLEGVTGSPYVTVTAIVIAQKILVDRGVSYVNGRILWRGYDSMLSVLESRLRDARRQISAWRVASAKPAASE